MSKLGTVCLILAGLLAAANGAVLGTYSGGYESYGGYGSYDGGYGGGYYDAGPSIPAAPITINGTARFFGPLADGCQVTYRPASDPTVITLGAVKSPNNTKVVVSSCKDLFTGQDIPYPVMGVARGAGTFDASSTLTIAAARNDTGVEKSGLSPARTVYQKLGVPIFNGDADVSVFERIRAGNLSEGLGMLDADFKFLAASTLITSALMEATANNGTTACPNRAALQQAFAGWVNTQAYFDPFDGVQVRDAIKAFSSAPCLVPSATITPLLSPLSQMVARAAGVAQPGDDDIGGVLFLVARMAKWVSMLSTIKYSDALDLQEDSFDAAAYMADASPIAGDQIARALGVTSYSAVDTIVNVQSVGRLARAELLYQPFTSLFNSSFSTSTNGQLKIAAATFGLYMVPAGAVDTFLTTDATAPVRTSIPMVGVSAFTGASNTFTLSPASAMVLVNWITRQGNGAGLVPAAANWRGVYETVSGRLPAADYFARDYTAGSGPALAVFVIDSMLPAIPSLGGNFISRAVNGSDIFEITTRLYMLLDGKPAAAYTNITLIVEMLTDVYLAVSNDYSPEGGSAMSAQGRRSLQQLALAQLAQLNTIITSLATGISASNSAMQEVLAVAQAAIAAGVTPPAAAFVEVSKVAQVQATAMAAEIAKVAALVASGDFAAAVTQAATVQEKFTGDNLAAAVAAAKVNTDAIQQFITPAEEKKSNKGLAIGLGVGLGVGLTALVAVGALLYIKKRRAAQSTAPAAPAAEGAEPV